MPPHNNTNGNSGLGWKLFFGLLMLVQGIGTTMMFRTYDAVQANVLATAKNDVKVDSIILPTLTRHESAIDRLTNQANAKQHP